MVTRAGSVTYGSFLDLQADVKPWLQFPLSDTSKDVALQKIIDGICQAFCRERGGPIGPQTYDRRFDGQSGWTGAHLMLPWYPVLEITSVVEYWGISGPHVLAESSPTAQVDGWQCTYQTGRLTRVFPGNIQKPWFPGSRNVEVTWVAGYDPLPADLELGALELIAYWFRNTQQQTAGRGTGPGAGETPTGLWPGMPNRIRDLLSPYRSQGIA